MMAAFRKLRFLGAGSYGSVHLAEPTEYTSWPSHTAVKSSKIHSSSLSISCLMREKKFLDELIGCPYVVQCFGDAISDEKGHTVYNVMMEYAPGGTLKELMKERRYGRIPEPEVACYTTMLLHGLLSVHGKGIVHCDLKPDNILVFPTKQKDGVLNHVVKIADFGVAKKVWEEDLDGCGRKRSLNRGTLLYASPEAVAYGDHLPANDVWALGCVVMEMLIGHPTWGYCSSGEELISRIALMEPEIPEYVSRIGGDFLTRCLEKDPRKRWTIPMLLNHPFIEDSLTDFRRGLLPMLPMPITALVPVLINAAPDQQRTMLGESLYPLVDQLEHEHAAKVTGMLLEMDTTEVLHLLETPEALKAKVSEAMDVLRNVQAGNSAADLLSSLSLNDNLVS